MKITIITMHRGDAEMFTGAVHGELTYIEKEEWRRHHKCDEYDGHVFDRNNMFFRVVELNDPDHTPFDLVNVDG